MRVTWADIKSGADSKSLPIQYIDINNAYWIKLFDGPFELECIINQDDLTDADLIDFETNYKAKANGPITPITTESQIPKVAIYKAQGSSSIKVTPNFTDRTTWYEKSTKVIDETLTLDTGKIYNSVNVFWLDLNHGKVYMENDITMDGTPMVFGGVQKYKAIIKDGGTILVEDTDYIIDHVSGSVTFDAGYSIVGVITATYYYAGASTFSIIPDAGKMIHIQHSELQFTDDLVMEKEVYFDIYVYNPMDFPNKILYKRTMYKNIRDIINAANQGQGIIPPVDVFTKPVIVFPFAYATEKTLRSSQGAELRVSIKDDTPFSGEWGTATFYLVCEDE